jgi:hypothetical protein
MRGWAVVVVLGLLAGCTRKGGAPTFTGEPYLVAWAGDADRQQPDFLAVLDADPTSTSYGKVAKTYPVQSRGNEPHGMLAEQRPDRRVFTTGLLGNRLFVFDLRAPLDGRLLRVDEAGASRRFWAPAEPLSLPDGHVVVTCADPAHYRGDPQELLAAPGGLLELDGSGTFVRERSAADPAARHLIIAPYGVAVSPTLGRLVTTNAGHGYAASTLGERMPGISVELWALDSLLPLRTVVLEAGPRGEENLGPVAARFLHRQPFLFVAADEGGALYGSDSVGTPNAAFKLVFDFGAGTLASDIVVTPDDRFLVAALAGSNRVVSLDVADPWRPHLVSSVRLDRDPLDPAKARRGAPSALAMSADGTRVAVADYGVTAPGITRDGDHRIYLLRLDPGSGRLRIDPAFQDEITGEVGVAFDRARWPHGATGAARPAALLFVTPEPPPSGHERGGDD